MIKLKDLKSIEWTLPILLILIIYSNVYAIPFLYFEISGIQQSKVIGDMGLFMRNMLTWKGFLHRPVSFFTYALNYYFTGINPASYHLVNVLIHSINTFFVYVLAKKIIKKNYLLASILFAVHPLATACVSQIHGRIYSIATMFMLIGFYLYVKFREENSLTIRNGIVLLFLFIVMLLSKQTLILFPFVILWFELYKESTGIRGLIKILSKRRILIFTGLGSCLVLLFTLLYAVPYSKTSLFTPQIYFISQLGNAVNLMKFYCLPFQTSLVHFLYFYKSLHYDVIIGALILALAIFVCLKYRRTNLGFLLGAILIAIFPTNSFMPKDDIIREWRLYPSLVFVCLFLTELVNLLLDQIHQKLKRRFLEYIVYILVVFYIGVQGYSVIYQNNIYHDEIDTWYQVVQKHRYSSDAFNNLGRAYANKKQYKEALHYFTVAKTMDPTNYIYYHNLSVVYNARKDFLMGEFYNIQKNTVGAKYGYRQYSYPVK